MRLQYSMKWLCLAQARGRITYLAAIIIRSPLSASNSSKGETSSRWWPRGHQWSAWATL